MAELADAPDLGSGVNDVGVQVSSGAPEKSIDFVGAFFNEIRLAACEIALLLNTLRV